MNKVKLVFEQFTSHEGSLFRYSLSFGILLALLPTLIVIVALFQNSVLEIEPILVLLYRYLPKDFMEPFIDYVMGKEYMGSISLIVSLIITAYVASKSFYSFMLVSARHEGFFTYKILIRMKSFVFYILFVACVIVLGLCIHFLKLNISITFIFGLFIVFYFLYRIFSFEVRPLSYGIHGAIFSSLMITLSGYIFFEIVKKFTSYNSIYGPLSSLVVLLLSVYVVANIMYFGYCINFIYGNRIEPVRYKSHFYYQTGEKLIEDLKKMLWGRKNES